MHKMNFCGIDPDNSTWERSKVCILPVPYDMTCSYRSGTREGPGAIIEASSQLELYDEELHRETYRVGISTLDELGVRDLAPEEMVARVYEASVRILKAGKFPVVLGGEHTVSIGMVRALKESYRDLSIIQLDAHADLRDEYENRRLSHACVGRRLAEEASLLQIGVRSLSREEAEYMERSKVKTIRLSEIIGSPRFEPEITSLSSNNTYITIDLDVLDPSIMPSVGTPEPGGLGWYKMLELMRYLTSRKKVVGFDVVELCPIKDNISPDFLAAKLVYRLLGYVFEKELN